MKERKKRKVCVFQCASLPLSLSPRRVVIHKLDLHAPMLMCAFASVLVNSCRSKCRGSGPFSKIHEPLSRSEPNHSV